MTLQPKPTLPCIQVVQEGNSTCPKRTFEALIDADGDVRIRDHLFGVCLFLSPDGAKKLRDALTELLSYYEEG